RCETKKFVTSSRRGKRHDVNKTGITRVTVKVGEPLPKGATDWQRLDTMTDEEATAAAPADPYAQPSTPDRLPKMQRVSRVKVLRQRLGMSQTEFARTFHLPIAMLQDWERRRSTPRCSRPRVASRDRTRSRDDETTIAGRSCVRPAQFARKLGITRR